LFLEAGGVLRSWRLAALPSPAAPVRAEPSADHRLMYLDYEGPVGGGRGRVEHWDAGTFEWACDEPGRVVVHVNGGKMRGELELRQSGGVWLATLKVTA
jgi:hypothetical protein